MASTTRILAVLPMSLAASLFAACGGPVGGGADGEGAELQDDLSASCSAHKPMRVRVYAVEQALAALVELPDGRHILVDTGAPADAPGCGATCAIAHQHLVDQLTQDLAGQPIDVMWITHQHIDHVGGAADLLARFKVLSYVDNGTSLDMREVVAAHQAALAANVASTVVQPGHAAFPLKSTRALRIRPIVPAAALKACNSDQNDCSIGLRIDYCGASVLFTGDAELAEEQALDPLGHATLLQLGHHGSDTSSGPAFLARVAPKIAVVSAGRPGVGMNRSYCHPRASTIERVTELLGGPGSGRLPAFDAAVGCEGAAPEHWLAVPTSDRLFATERDGDLVFLTTGGDEFSRE
jgi:competence protein ComEC